MDLMCAWLAFAKIVPFRQLIDHSMLVTDFSKTFDALVTILKIAQFNCNVDYWFGTEIFDCSASYVMIRNNISSDFSLDGILFS